jgi:hypothetical protein
MIKTLLLMVVLTVGQLQESAKTAIDNAEKAVLNNKVVVTPKVEECPCKGTGYIKHGDGNKTACPGTDAGPCKFRRSGDAAAQPVKEHALIIMYSAKDNPDGTNPCVWCRKWKKEILPSALKQKWRVREKIGEPGKGVPYFEVFLYGKKYKHDGYMSFEALGKIVAKAKQEANK